MTSVNYEIRGDAAINDQMALLRQFPVLADAHFRPGMEEAVSALYSGVEPNIPTLSGAAKAVFYKKVSGTGVRLTGRVGFSDVEGVPSSESWYPNALEYGVKPHLIKPKIDSGWLAIGKRITTLTEGAAEGFARVVRHPGFPARSFMKKGFMAAMPIMNMLFGKAGEAMVNALVYKGTRSGGGRAGYNRK